MTEPNWDEAPEGATHWDRLRGNWCSPHGFYHDGKFWGFMHYEWGTDRYIPRPEKDHKMNDYMTPEEEKLTAEDWIEDAPTLSDQAERMYHQPAQVDTKNYDVPNTVGSKHDTGKPMWHLMPPDAQAAIVDVLTYGANKYAPENWRKVSDADNRYYSALMRHLHAWRQGETHDKESGLHHLAHAGCCLVFLLQLAAEGQE